MKKYTRDCENKKLKEKKTIIRFENKHRKMNLEKYAVI